jgi:cytochrome c-type biogenesis protein CcmH
VKRLVSAAAVVALLAVAGAAAGSEKHPTLAELENELVCPTCHTTLALSNAPVADRMRAFIRQRIAAGDTKSEIKEKLVESFGEGVLAAPTKKGFNLLAWILPLAGGAVAVVLVGLAARRWARSRPESELPRGDPAANGRSPLDPELERRLDEELARFDT